MNRKCVNHDDSNSECAKMPMKIMVDTKTEVNGKLVRVWQIFTVYVLKLCKWLNIEKGDNLELLWKIKLHLKAIGWIGKLTILPNITSGAR